MRPLIALFEDFLTLIYPRHCVACQASLYRHEQHLCNRCFATLPRSGFHQKPGNALEKLFYGRSPIEAAASYYLFQKNTRVQRILHAIKYNNNRELAIDLGRYYGNDLRTNAAFSAADLIFPVPLHPKKKAKRGYNQSELLARGLSESLSIPTDPTNLQRDVYGGSQTKKTKTERWENVAENFSLRKPAQLAGKHVILVDDVITTGSTIEACCDALHRAGDVKISVLSLAFASPY